VHLLDLAPGLVIDAAYLEMLEAEGLTESVAILREYTIGGGEAG